MAVDRAILLGGQSLAQAWGKTFEIRQAPAKLLSLIKLYGVDALLSRGAATAAAST